MDWTCPRKDRQGALLILLCPVVLAHAVLRAGSALSSVRKCLRFYFNNQCTVVTLVFRSHDGQDESRSFILDLAFVGSRLQVECSLWAVQVIAVAVAGEHPGERPEAALEFEYVYLRRPELQEPS